MPTPRRTFLAGLGAAVLAPSLARPARAGRPGRLPLAFSTLGCPAWSWKKIVTTADELGYAAIELRGIEGEMDLTKRPELQGAQLKATLAELEDLNLEVSDLGASTRLHEKDAASRGRHLDEGRRFVDLAHAMRVPYVRVFGDALPADEPRAAVLARIADGLRTLAAHAKGSGVTVLIESHGDFVTSPLLSQVLDDAGPSGVALLWDAHHTAVMGKEAPAETWKALKARVRHTHLKDSRAEGTGRRYVLTGSGDVPVKETVQLLAAAKYDGYYCFEWEKKWHPEIEEPEIALPHFAKLVGGWLEAAGLCTC
jgi:sugar phosphate isomerase/epimerase